MKVLITGGAGFIGSHIVEEVISKGYEVVIVDNLSSGSRENIANHLVIHQVDITSPDLETVFQKENPDFVIHQAAQVSVPFSMKNPMYDSKLNILGTLNLLQYCIQYDVQKLVFASTAAVYGEPDYNPIDERHSVEPESSYGISKSTAETFISLYGKRYGLNYSILRYANVYGARQNSNGEAGVVSIFLNRLLENKDIYIFGDGHQTRDFVYAKDVAHACLLALERGECQTLNISSQTETSINELVTMLSDLMDKEINPVHKLARDGDLPQSCLMNNHAKEQLLWEPQFTIEQGLKETIHYFKK